MKTTRLLLVATLLATMLPARAQITVSVNCTKWVDHPLVKKIGVYQTPLVSRAWLDRDLPKLDELEARAMRYEMACGKDDLYGQPCVIGTAARPVYSMTNVDYLLTKSKRYTPVLVISHGYTPTILQRRPTEWAGFMDPPTDLSVWADINRRFAQEWKQKKYTNSYVEVWNEPDLTDGFFTGTLADYLDIYEAAAPAVTEGYADIKVGGPAGAFSGWHQSLVDRAKAKGLPLDFLSGHAYGPNYSWQLNDMRSALASLGNPQAEMLLTEYSPYEAKDYQADGPVERAESAMTFFNALPGMLACPDLTYVTWAQYIDPGFFVGDKLGLIDRETGSRKALFNAFKLYAMMPADRRQITISSGKLDGLASASDHCVTAVVWNTESTEKTFKMTLTGVPFDSGTLEVYHIDERTNSWYETRKGNLATTTSEHIDVPTNNRVALEGVVRSKGVCFVQLVADDAPTLYPDVRLGTIVRTRQWFPNRTNDAAYAIFDPKTWTVRLSSNAEASGRALVGVEAEKLPDYLKVDGVRKGTITNRGTNSTINIRLDYQDTSGAYTHSVLFHGGQYNTARSQSLPWGTKRQPDEVVEVDNLNDCTIPVAAHAPADFSGRVLISFEMAVVGAGVKQNFQLAEGVPTAIRAIGADGQAAAGATAHQHIYSLSGQQLSRLSPGVNIVRQPDGSAHKLFHRQ